jgi:hypothetical protein
MKVDHRGLYGTMTEAIFYGLNVLPALQKMCGVRMAERVSSELRVKPGTRQGFRKPHANKVIVDRFVRPETFKHEIHTRVASTVGFQDNQRLGRDWDSPVLSTLATFDVNHPPMEVYICPLQVTCFKGTKAAIVDYGKQGLGIQLTGVK